MVDEDFSLMDKYLSPSALVQHQTESYNRFVDTGIKKIVAKQSLIEPSVEGFALKLGNVRIGSPSIIEADSSRRSITPNEARLRNVTYSAPIFMEVIPVIRGIEKVGSYGDVFVGELPVMVGSSICNTRVLSRDQLIENGEDPDDPGGYFIIKGVERVLIGLEDVASNRIITTKEKGGTEVKSRVFSSTPGFRARCVVSRNQNGIFTVDFPTVSKSIDLILLLRALGLQVTDMKEYASDVLHFKNDILLCIETSPLSENGDMQPSEALWEIGKMAAPGQAKEYQIKRAETQMDSYLLPHIGNDATSRKEKARYLLQMARKGTLVANKMVKQDDKDHYANKRVRFSGELMEELFAYAFRFFLKEVKYQVERMSARGRRLGMQSIISPDTLTEKIAYAMGTGMWVAGQTGVSQVLDRTNMISTYAHLRRVKSPLAKKHPHFKARDVHGTQWGKICVSESPEGQEVGLTKYLALLSRVTVGADEAMTEQELKKIGIKEF
ncbi:MAG: DNA-directed RNA polymerase subunit B'' [Candidatus Marsarchaeota archaeon]|jgi:DNA-directed RNA polymerase subunit B"|nr:DNA-directed RNA polymerase subunit B'' [Candidatus Marsarchaeota archaeon]